MNTSPAGVDSLLYMGMEKIMSLLSLTNITSFMLPQSRAEVRDHIFT
jgi:hypothetical protein